MVDVYAFLAVAVLGALAIFQLALIAGAPIGKFAWGGAHRVLPAKLRIGSIVSIILYAIFSIIILDKADVIDVIPNDMVVNIGIWILTAYFFIGVLMNGISRSKYERYTMTPIAFILAILCLLVALG